MKIDKHNGYVLYRIIIYKEYLTNGLPLKDLENGLLVYQESFSMTLVENDSRNEMHFRGHINGLSLQE